MRPHNRSFALVRLVPVMVVAGLTGALYCCSTTELFGTQSHERRLQLTSFPRAHPEFQDPVSVVTKTSSKEKPYFIMHIGPGKTATSTIQRSLYELSSVLARDHYVYVGDYGEVAKNKASPMVKMVENPACQRELEGVRLSVTRGAGDPDLAAALSNVTCWTNFLRHLEPYRQREQSVIMSHEGFSFRMFNFQGIGKASVDWIALRETLEKDWNVLVVIGYRRYFSWLQSAKQQNERPEHREYLSKWPGQGGQAIDPMFPNYWRENQPNRKQPWSFTDSIMATTQRHVPVAIFNYHDPMSIRSNFLCNILPKASITCNHSVDLDRKEAEMIVNPGLLPRYYDMLVTAAAEKGMIDIERYSRRRAEDLARQFQESALQLTVWDFPVQCPSTGEMDQFLEKSLRLEAQILPKFAASPIGEARHRAEFWSALRKFCSIDTEAVLENENWKRFFASDMDISKTTVL